MEDLGKWIAIVTIIIILIFVSEIVLLPFTIAVTLPLMPVVKTAEFVSSVAQKVSSAALFLERHFNIGTGTNAFSISNEAYSYNWMMGQFAKVVSFSKVLVSHIFKKYTPMRRTDVPLGAPIPMQDAVYPFMSNKFKEGTPFYGEIERYVSQSGKEIPPNNAAITVPDDGGDTVSGINPSLARGRNPKEWLNITGKTVGNPINVMDGILYDSDSYMSISLREDAKEEAAWKANEDEFLKRMTDKWNKEDKAFKKWLSQQYTVIDGKKYPYLLAYHIKKVTSEFQLNACWVYSPIEGWCLKKEGLDKDGVYPALGTREQLIFLPKDGYHIYAHGKMINKETYEHRYVGVVLTGLRTIGAEKLAELRKQKGLDAVLSIYYGYSQGELDKMSDTKKEQLYGDITTTNNARDSYALLMQGKPFPKKMLEYWLESIVSRTNDDSILQMLSYVDKDGFFVKLHEKGNKGISPLSKGRVYTDPDGNLFTHYNPVQPVPKNFNVFDRNAPTPLFLAETSHATGIMMKYFYDSGYLYAYKDSDSGKVKWQLVKRNPILLGQRSRVWGPNPEKTAKSQVQNCKNFLPGCPECYKACMENNEKLQEQEKNELAHENHAKKGFPVFYKIIDLGQGISSKIVDTVQEEKEYKAQIYYNLLMNGYQKDKSGLFAGIPLDPSVFMNSTESFLNYTEGGSGKAPTKVLYPKAITDATPWGVPLTGCISSPFGWRDEPVHEFHLGVDIAVPTGTEVHSTSSGTVYYAGWSNGYGFVVEIESHDSSYWYLTKYAHLEKCLVSTGDSVTRGQVIALSDSTGFSTGPHLHYEIHVAENEKDLHSSDTAQDPVHWGVNLPKCP